MIFLCKLLLSCFFAFLINHLFAGLVYIENIGNPMLLYYVYSNINNYDDLDNLIKAGNALSIVIFFLFMLLKANKANQYGFSRYAKIKDRKEAKLDTEEGICLGKMVIPDNKDFLDINKFKQLNKKLKMNQPLSVGVLAPPGTGKTSAVIIPTLLESKNSFIVNDPKGELFSITAPTRSTFSKINRFDPMQVNGKGSTFNPFSKNMLPKDERKWFNYVKQISNILIVDSEKGDDAFFTNNARTIFTFVACYLIKIKGKTSLPEIASKILEDSDVVNTFTQMIDEIDELEEQNSFTKAVIKQGNASLSSAEAPQTWESG